MRALPAIAAGASVAALLAVWIGLGIGGDTVVLWVDDLATTGSALFATLACGWAARRSDPAMRRFWWLLASASAAWMLAESTWMLYELTAGDVPDVSLADVGYLAGIALAVAALMSHPALRADGTGSVRSLIDGIAVALALLSLSWTFVLGPVLGPLDIGTLGGLVTFAYPVGDVVLIFFVILAVRRMTSADRPSLRCLLGGLFAMAIADSAYAYLVGVGGYVSGGLLDVGWIVAYLGIGLSALLADPQSEFDLAESETTTRPLASLVAPLLPALVALAAITVEVHRGHQLDTVCVILALSLIALVLVRGALLAVEVGARGEWEDRGLLARTRSTLLSSQTVVLDPDRSSHPVESGP